MKSNFLLNLLFPPVCLHCKAYTSSLFCSGCAAYFELIDPLTRCPYCFAENDGRRPCPDCVRKKRWYIRIASAIDYLGPTQTLVKKLKYGRMPFLAKTAAAFMLMQHERLGWERPDVIVPVPRRLWFQGTNHAALIAQGLADHFKVKMRPLVVREAGDFSQARLTKVQRERLISAHFFLKKKEGVSGKRVLLVDDVMTTGTTLLHTAEALREGIPKEIYALTLARAIF